MYNPIINALSHLGDSLVRSSSELMHHHPSVAREISAHGYELKTNLMTALVQLQTKEIEDIVNGQLPELKAINAFRRLEMKTLMLEMQKLSPVEVYVEYPGDDAMLIDPMTLIAERDYYLLKTYGEMRYCLTGMGRSIIYRLNIKDSRPEDVETVLDGLKNRYIARLDLYMAQLNKIKEIYDSKYNKQITLKHGDN